jgi:hypothetical protein
MHVYHYSFFFCYSVCSLSCNVLSLPPLLQGSVHSPSRLYGTAHFLTRLHPSRPPDHLSPFNIAALNSPHLRSKRDEIWVPLSRLNLIKFRRLILPQRSHSSYTSCRESFDPLMVRTLTVRTFLIWVNKSIARCSSFHSCQCASPAEAVTRVQYVLVHGEALWHWTSILSPAQTFN